MSKTKPERHEFKASEEVDGRRLDQVLASRLPLSRGKCRELISSGSVFVNGRRVGIASKPIAAGTRILVMVDPEPKEKALNPAKEESTPEFQFDPSTILYEDDAIIAVNKPAGIPSQATLDPRRPHLYGELSAYLRKRDGARSYCGLHHRLDRDTSGVIVFSKDKRANGSLGEIFSQHKLEKIYLALCKDSPDLQQREWRMETRLGRDIEARGKTSRFRSVKKGGRSAETVFRIAGRSHGIVQIEARPITGRTHQIRVHLSESGLPILGDTLYGGSTDAARTMLHAASIAFKHPLHGREVRIDAPLPPDFLALLSKI